MTLTELKKLSEAFGGADPEDPALKNKLPQLLLSMGLDPDNLYQELEMESGYVDCSNYISNPGSHFMPDYHELFAIGFKGHYEKAKNILAGLDFTQPENVDKRDFYEGIMEVCQAIREYGQRLKAYAYEAAEKETDETRKAELIAAGDRSEKIRTYNFPQGRVTDHRIHLTLHRLDNVLNGDLDEIIDSLTAADQAEKLTSLQGTN